MRDPYDVLGVSKTASEAEVKSAYRKLAKKLHPDANKQDPKAASRFAELNAAYEILGEDDKRKAFARGEIDADGQPRFRGFEGFGGGGVGVYADCFTDYCAEYDDTGLQRLYLRIPGTPAGSRSTVVTAAPRGETQVVLRDPGAPAPASARMAPIPSPRPSGGRKP